MKRKITSIVLALVIVCSLFSMTACGKKDTQGTTAPENAIFTLVVGSKSPVIYEINYNKVDTSNGIMSVLEYLRNEKGLQYESNYSTYGSFITRVGDLKQNDNVYLYIYTSVEKDRDVSEYSKTIKFEGRQLFSAGVGASELTIEPGCIIYIGTTTY